MNIGHIELPNSLFVAPMAGVTDRPFRQLCKRLGAGYAVSEMVTSRKDLWNSLKTSRRANHDGEVAPISVQIAGTDAAMMAEAAAYNIDRGAQIIDINMGCPAKKVCNKWAGSALMQDEPLALEIVEAVVAACAARGVPVTLKMRTGWCDSERNALRIARAAESAGIAMVTVHGRTREQGYKGMANWDLIKAVKDAVSIPVSGNGDITTIEYGMRRWRESGVNGILIGRGAMQNPWIFRQFNDVLNGRQPYQPDLEEKKAVLLEFFEMCIGEMPEIVALGKMKQLAGQFTKGLVGGAQFRQTLYHSHSAHEILENITTYFNSLAEQNTFGDGEVEADRDLEFESCDAGNLTTITTDRRQSHANVVA